MTAPPERGAQAGPSAVQQGLSARPEGRIYLRVATAASPSHGLCRPPLSGSSCLCRRGLQSEAGARPRGARTHTLTPRGPAPLRLSVARTGTPHAVPIGRAPQAPQVPQAPQATSPLPRLSGAGNLGRCARVGTHHSNPSTQGRPSRGVGRPLHARDSVVLRPQQACGACGPRAGPQQQIQARRCKICEAAPPHAPPPCPADLPSGGQVCESRWDGIPGASSSARTWGACRTQDALAGTLGGAARAGRPGVRPARREAAPFVTVTEPCLRAVQLPRRRWRRAGCDHLGRCCPLPRRRGGISLKEAGASLFLGRGRPAPCKEEGAATPAPESGRWRTSCFAAAFAGSWGVGIQLARSERLRSEPTGARIDSEHCHSLGALRAAPVSGPPNSRQSDPALILQAIPGLSVTQRPGPVSHSVSYTHQ
ncbi:uncharacterized protein LOC118977734 [Sturnira hondurensis]|uniref:uncharacterized protein LOC118977734 n=1 Tax=Sturnira hondurensis TaxID=192404 RepID=UPI00187A2A04|nr:uncharacterized protein LOC118977734 [Sturnira hondurensis]